MEVLNNMAEDEGFLSVQCIFFSFPLINGIIYSKSAAVFRLTATDKAVNI